MPFLINPQYRKDIELKVELAKKVHESFKKRITNEKDYTPTNSSTPKLKAVRYTGIPECSYPKETVKKIKISNYVKTKLREIVEEIIYEQYIKKKVLPVLKHVSKANPAWLAAVKKEFTKASLSVLLNNSNLPLIMKKLGFKWQRLPGTDKKFITERPEYVNARFKYLNFLKQRRLEQQTVIYLDIFNLTEQLEAYADTKIEEFGPNFVMIAVSSTTGLLFKSHLEQNLNGIWGAITGISLLLDHPDDTVIVVGDDNGATKILDNFRARRSTRTEMVGFLESNRIPYRKDMHRCELFDLCQKFASNAQKQDNWDATLAAISQQVLDRPNSCIRRPKWMKKFSIFHDFWVKMKDIDMTIERSKRNPGLKYFHLFNANVYKTDWNSLEAKLIERESNALQMDKDVEDLIESLMLMVKEKGLSSHDLKYNDFDDVASTDDEDHSISISDPRRNLLT